MIKFECHAKRPAGEILYRLIVEETVQDMAYKISDLCESYSSEQTVFFLAAETLHVRAVLPLLGSKDREIYDKLLNASTTAVMPRSMDPRKGRE